MKKSEQQKKLKIVINSYPDEKDPRPNIIEIEKETGHVHAVTKHDKLSLSQLRSNVYITLHDTFLPVGYPHSVAEGYLRFAIFNNLSALSITAMSFLSAQSLFVAIGR